MGKHDHTLKKKISSSNSSNYNLNNLIVNTPKTSHNIAKTYPALAQIGDLVTSTTKELNYPRTFSAEISPGYLFFRIVVSSFPVMVDVSWANIELRHESKDIVEPNIGKSRGQKI